MFSHPAARKFVHQNSPRSASRDPTCLLSRRPPPQQCSLGHFGSSHFPHMYIRKVHTVRTRYALYASYGKAAPAAQFSTCSTLGCHIPHAALNLLGSRTICPLAYILVKRLPPQGRAHTVQVRLIDTTQKPNQQSRSHARTPHNLTHIFFGFPARSITGELPRRRVIASWFRPAALRQPISPYLAGATVFFCLRIIMSPAPVRRARPRTEPTMMPASTPALSPSSSDAS